MIRVSLPKGNITEKEYRAIEQTIKLLLKKITGDEYKISIKNKNQWGINEYWDEEGALQIDEKYGPYLIIEAQIKQTI